MTIYDKPPRNWTDAEINAAITFIKQSRPKFWEELTQAELAGGSLGSDPGSIGSALYLLVGQAQPTADRWELMDLLVEVRRKLQTELGIFPGRK